MSTETRVEDDEMPDEIDFSGGVRGKYASAYRAGTNVVLLDADVMERFPDSGSVNEALRSLIKASEKVPGSDLHAKAS